MFVESRSVEEAPRVTTSTDKLEVTVLPHMAESHVRVLVNNSAVRTESELPAPSFEVKRLPHGARVTWKLHNKNSLSVPTQNSGGATAIRLGTPWLGKADSAAGKYFWRPSQVYRGSKLVWWALHEEAFPPENRQPMFRYYLRKFHLRCHRSRYEAAGVVYVPSGG